MTEAQFIKNHRGIDRGKDPPQDLLEGMYRRVKVSSPARSSSFMLYNSFFVSFQHPTQWKSVLNKTCGSKLRVQRGACRRSCRGNLFLLTVRV